MPQIQTPSTIHQTTCEHTTQWLWACNWLILLLHQIIQRNTNQNHHHCQTTPDTRAGSHVNVSFAMLLLFLSLGFVMLSYKAMNIETHILLVWCCNRFLPRVVGIVVVVATSSKVLCHVSRTYFYRSAHRRRKGLKAPAIHHPTAAPAVFFATASRLWMMRNKTLAITPHTTRKSEREKCEYHADMRFFCTLTTRMEFVVCVMISGD